MKRASGPSLLLVFTLVSCSTPTPPVHDNRPMIASVSTVAVSEEEIAEFYEAVGTVRSKTTTVLSARTTGQITSLPISLGDRVRAGAVLLEIDRREPLLQVQRAAAGESEARGALTASEAEVAAAESSRTGAVSNRSLAASTLERYRSLHERRSVSDQEFEEVQARLAAATAEMDRATQMLEAAKARQGQSLARLEQARAQKANADLYLEFTRVVSPSDGIVTERGAEVGAMAAPGRALVTIEDSSLYRLEAQVAESMSASIRLGDTVHVKLEGDLEMQGTISEIVPSADVATRSRIVKVDLPAGVPGLSGTFGRAYFPSAKRQGLLIPRKLVAKQGQLTFVYVLDNKVVRQRLIKSGKTVNDRVEVLSGLQSGDLVITDPLERLVDGIEVRQ